MVRLALFEPDIPQNTGAMMRLCACLGVAMDIVEPCGFALSDKALKRVVMDYLGAVDLTSHMSWGAFLDQCRAAPRPRRLVLLSTAGRQVYTEFDFDAGDTIIVGRESAGAPPNVHDSADAVLRVPMVAGARSLNVASAAALVIGEALRQTEWRRGGDGA